MDRKITFKYSLEKDVENFLKSFKSVNSSTRTKLEERYLEKSKELQETNVSKFLASQGIDTDSKLKEISEAWRKIENEVIDRMDKMFGIKLSSLPVAYLSSNSRCTYNTSGNYFFVKMTGGDTNRNIAHELLHFYTWYAFSEELEKKGVSKEKYNDIKESLTEVLNTDFSDLLRELDTGYPQHHDLRIQVKHMRGMGKSIKDIFLTLANSNLL